MSAIRFGSDTSDPLETFAGENIRGFAKVPLEIESIPMLPKNRTRIVQTIIVFALAAISGASALACGGDSEPTVVALPTATPGAMSTTPTPVVYQDDSDGTVQIGFNLGLQDYPQQGAGVVSQLDRGTRIKITVRPAPGVIQQISIREGRCEDAGDISKFKWVETLDHAIGGVSETDLPDLHVTSILDGNHAIAVSIPGGTFSQVATCGNLPNLTHLEIPDAVEG